MKKLLLLFLAAVGVALGAPAGTPVNNAILTGITSISGATVRPANAMGALVIDVTKSWNTKTISADTVFTFTGTPANTNQFFTLFVTNSDGAATHALTIPSSYGIGIGPSITTVTIPISGKLALTWQYDGSAYNLYNAPPVTTGTGNVFVLSLNGTISGATMVQQIITNGFTAVGNSPNDLSGSTGTFLSSTGANTLNGAVTINAATTPSVTTAASKTNTGFFQVNGKTSGSLKLITADATAQAVTVTAAAQTTSATTVTIPDMGGTNDTVVMAALAQTLTTKRVTARVTSITSSATPAVNTDACDCVNITALAAAITSMTSSLTGTPVDFDQLEYRIKDNGTARAITWGASFATGTGTLPTTTTLSKVLHVYFEWDAVQTKWICASSGSEP